MLGLTISRMPKRWQRRVDTGRLEYFQLSDERPIETFMMWVPTAWPKALPFGDVDAPQVVTEGFLSSPMLVPAKDLTDETGDISYQLFGCAILPLLCVVVVTDHRLHFQPVPSGARNRGLGRYGRFDAACLGPRAIEVADIDSMEPINLGSIDVARRMTVSLAASLSAKNPDRPMVDGPRWPSFLSGLGGETGVLLAPSFSPMVDLLARALVDVGVRVEPRGYRDHILSAFPKWQPMHSRGG